MMIPIVTPLVIALNVSATSLPLQAQAQEMAPVRVSVVKQPYRGARNVPELSLAPDYVHAAGLEEWIREWGGELVGPVAEVRLTSEQQRQYGAWERVGMANGHLARSVADAVADGLLTVALEANCTSVLGVLGGLQHPPSGPARRVGLVFIDAHGDFNTPETTLSGMLGGMPVAVAAGHGLERLRVTSGLAEPVPMDRIVWAGVRDLDPLEAARFREHGVRQLSVDDLRTLSARFRSEIERLTRENDYVYVHIDMDVLDPAEVPGHSLNVPNGPSSEALAGALEAMFRYPNVVALGLASTPAGSDDPDELSRRAALNLIRGALRGARQAGARHP